MVVKTQMFAGAVGRGNPRFERAAKKIQRAMTSRTPLRLQDFERQFADFNRPLKLAAGEMLGQYGVPHLEAAVTEAIEQFYRRMLLEGGFSDYLSSGQNAFWPFAQKALKTICFELSHNGPLAGSRR